MSSFVFGFCLIALGHSIANAQWTQSLRSGNTAYFLFPSTPRLERISLTNGQWLPPINLPTLYGSASAFGVDADTLYVAYGQTVKRYDLAGSNEVHVVNVAETVQGIFTDGNVILLNRSVSLYARLTSISKSNNAVIAQFENYVYALNGASIAPSINKLSVAASVSARRTSPTSVTTTTGPLSPAATARITARTLAACAPGFSLTKPKWWMIPARFTAPAP